MFPNWVKFWSSSVICYTLWLIAQLGIRTTNGTPNRNQGCKFKKPYLILPKSECNHE